MHFEVESLVCRVVRCMMCQMTQRACTKASYIACFSWWVNVFSPVMLTKKGRLLTCPCCASLGYHSGSQKSLDLCLLATFKKKKNKLGSGEKKKIGFFFLFNDMIVLQWGKVLFLILLLLVFCLELCMISEAWVSLFSSTAALVLFT